MAIIGSGLPINNITLIAVPVPIDNIGSLQSNLMFLTSGLGGAAAQAGAKAATEKILCITTDLSATRAGNCAVGIVTAPNVKITINKATADASDIEFVSDFMLLIKEI